MSNADQPTLPADWKIQQLAELGTPVRGGSPRPAGDPRFFNGNYIPWLTVASLTGIPDSQLTVNETATYLTQEGSLRSRTLSPGTLIIANSGATLGVAKILGIQCCANDGIAALLNPVPNIDVRYLAHFINTQIKSLRNVVATGNGQPNLNTGLIGAINVPVPSSVDEQSKIADSLSDVDDLIRGLDQLIAKRRDIQQATMQQLLSGQRRLPGFSGEWAVKRLGDHLSFLRNGTNSRAELSTEGNVHYLHYGDIHGSQHLLLNPSKTSMPCLPRDKAKRLDRLESGDLVFADASEDLDGVGKSVEVELPEGMELVSGLHTIAARFDKKIIADGFKAYLQFIPAFRLQLRQLAAGTKVYATNRAHIASAELRIPAIDEQTAIATILSDMDSEIAALEARRDKTRQLKKGMMQELLTGQIRLV